MGKLDGRVAIVTGAGRGLGREHALRLAAEGAMVVVNDIGGEADGTGADTGPASEVVQEITSGGGAAVANCDNVASWEGAQRLINAAIETYGDLHVLVNNAGILRDRALVNMTEEEWDSVVAVHLKGHFATTRWALAYWRDQTKAGHEVRASVVNTSSVAGLVGNYGQANYGAAKSGIAALTIVGAMEAARYGVRMNAIAPVARTRMTMATGDAEAMTASMNAPFDAFDPANVSPLVSYLAMAGCPVTGAVFHVAANQIGVFVGWELARTAERDGRWEIEHLEEAVPNLLEGKLAMGSVLTDMTSFSDTFVRAVSRRPTAVR